MGTVRETWMDTRAIMSCGHIVAFIARPGQADVQSAAAAARPYRGGEGGLSLSGSILGGGLQW